MATKNLTDKTIQAAKAPKAGRVELWDAKTPGLCLRVTPRLKTWVYRYRTADGRQPRFRLGEYPAMKLADAQTAARTHRNAVQGGGDPQGERRRKNAEARAQPLKTLADLWEAYRTACETGEWKPRKKRKRASTLGEETRLWKTHIKPALGAVLLEDLTPAGIKKLLRGLVRSGAGVTSNRVRALLRQLINFAIAEGRLETNPVMRVDALGTETARERVLSDQELVTLWAALGAPSGLTKPGANTAVRIGAPVRIAVRLLLLTLARRAEVAGMRVDELDLERRTWLLSGERTKSGRPHLVPLAPEAVRLIKEALALASAKGEASPFVFPSPRSRKIPITAAALSHAFRDLRLAIELEDVRPHDLRRTASTLLASERLGASPVLIGRLLNHSSETGGAATVTMRHYALHDYATEKRRALEAWEGLLLKIVEERERPSNLVPLSRGA
jgi:integrase